MSKISNSALNLFVSKVLSSIISFAGVTFFARELGAVQMGIFFLFQSILGILTIPADLGLRVALEKKLSEGQQLPPLLSSFLTLKLLLLVAVSLTILLLQGIVNEYIGSNVAILLVIALVLQEVAFSFEKVLFGELRAKDTAILRPIRQLTWVSIGTAVILVGTRRAYAPIVGFVFGYFAMSIVAIYRSSVTIAMPTVRHTKELIGYAKHDFVSFIGWRLFNWTDIAIIGLLLGQKATGAYGIAWQISEIVMLLGYSIANTLFPKISSLSQNDEWKEIEQLVTDSISPSFVLVIPSIFGAFLLSSPLLSILFGSSYSSASIALIILFIGKIPQVIYILLADSLRGVGKQRLSARSTIISGLSNIGLNILLIHLYQIEGAAVATSLSFTLNSILHIYYLDIPVTVPFTEILWYIISSAVMFICIFIILSIVQISGIYSLLAVIFTGAAIYFVTLLAKEQTRKEILDLV